jgi:hypothetical protein
LDVAGTGRFSDGILFGTDTAAANTLHDYEEGNWTPQFTNEDLDSNTASATLNDCHYVKVGAQVTLWAKLANIITGDASGNFTIKNLPYTVEAKQSCGTVMFNGWNFASLGVNNICAYVKEDETIRFFETIDNGTWDAVDWTENDSAANDCNFFVTYRTTQ